MIEEREEKKMRLIFVLNGRIFIEGKFSNNATLQEIKHNIEICRRIPISLQTLSFNGNIIANDADLRAADLTDGSRITLHIDKPRITAGGGDSTQPFKYRNPSSPASDFINQFLNAAEKSPEFNTVDELMNAGVRDVKKSFITLKISDPFNSSVNIEASYNLTVLQLKLMIQEITYIPIAQILIKDEYGNQLIDAMTVLHPQNPDQSELDVKFLQPPASPLSQSQSSESNTTVDRDSKQPPPEKVGIALKMLSPFNVTINIEATDNNQTILELKLAIQEVTKIPIGQIVIKYQYGKELRDATTLLQSQNPDKSELIVEFLQPPPPPMPRPMLPLPLQQREMIRVALEYKYVRVRVDVAAAGKVGQLRMMLDENKVRMYINLPNPYFFIYNEDGIDENCSFSSQNIAEGAIIEISPGRVAREMRFKLKTNKPNTKAYFDVLTHSDDTILEMKEKISTTEGIPVDRILIRKNGIEQPDHKALHACSITSDMGVTVDILDE